MPSRLWIFRIKHILDAIGKIQNYTSGMTYELFRKDPKTVDSVLTNFMIVGEAVRNIPEKIQRRYPEVPWPLMRAMRNVIVHECDRIDLETIWLTIENDLNPIMPMLLEILKNESEPPCV